MKQKFIVAYISFFENDLTQTLVEAESAIEAANIILVSHGYTYDTNEFNTLEKLSLEVFNSAVCINVMEIL